MTNCIDNFYTRPLENLLVKRSFCDARKFAILIRLLKDAVGLSTEFEYSAKTVGGCSTHWNAFHAEVRTSICLPAPSRSSDPIVSFVPRQTRGIMIRKRDGLEDAETLVHSYRLIAFPTRTRVLFVAISS